MDLRELPEWVQDRISETAEGLFHLIGTEAHKIDENTYRITSPNGLTYKISKNVNYAYQLLGNGLIMLHIVPNDAEALKFREIIPVAVIRKLIELEDAGPYKSTNVMSRIWYRSPTHYYCAVYYKLDSSRDAEIADDVTLYTIE